MGEYNYETDIDCIQEESGFDCADKPIDVAIEKVIIHPSYSSTTYNSGGDIALIKLIHLVEYTDFIRPICLPTENFKLKLVRTFTVVGWGRTDLCKFDYHRTLLAKNHQTLSG